MNARSLTSSASGPVSAAADWAETDLAPQTSASDFFTLPLPKGGLHLKLTLDCGQVFHWREIAPGKWHGLIGETPCTIWVERQQVCCTAEPELVRQYFRFQDDLPRFARSFPAHPFAQAARLACRGLRLVQQPFWECLGTFLCSSVKQVSHIRQVTDALRQRLGSDCGQGLFRFPSPERIARAEVRELAACGLGFRAARLRETARMLAEGVVREEHLRHLPTEQARLELQKLPGVGVKIAHCVLLFSLGRLESVPVDVWVGRIFEVMEGRRLTAKERQRKAEGLGPWAGYVQQCLFHHARVHRALNGSFDFE